MQNVRIAMYAAGLAAPAEIIAQQGDDHDVLGAILGASFDDVGTPAARLRRASFRSDNPCKRPRAE
jgi:hypothetical protein